MKYLSIIILLCLTGCSVFHTTPESVIKGVEALEQLSYMNENNFNELNVQYYRVLKKQIEQYAPPEKRDAMLKELEEFYSGPSVKRAMEQNTLATQLARAIKEYFSVPGADLTKIIGILELLKDAN